MQLKQNRSLCTLATFGTLLATFMGQGVLAETTPIITETRDQTGGVLDQPAPTVRSESPTEADVQTAETEPASDASSVSPEEPQAAVAQPTETAIEPVPHIAPPDTSVTSTVPDASSPQNDPAYEAACNALGTDLSRSYAAYQRAGSPSGNFLDYNIERARKKRTIGLVFLLALTPAAVAGVTVSAVRYQKRDEEIREMEAAGLAAYNKELQAVYSKRDAAGIGMIASSAAGVAFLVIGSVFTGKGAGRMRRLKSAQSSLAFGKHAPQLAGISPLVTDASGLSGASLTFTFSSGL